MVQSNFPRRPWSPGTPNSLPSHLRQYCRSVKILNLDVKYVGESFESKIKRLSNIISNQLSEALITFKPDAISWLLNIRGDQLKYTPVVRCFALIHKNKKIYLFFENDLPQISKLNHSGIIISNVNKFKSILKMFIGVTGYNHESSAALVDENGVLIDYCTEESLSRIKGDKSFPRRSINKLLVSNNLKIKDIVRVAFYERPLSSFLHTAKEASLHMPMSLSLLAHQFRNFNRSSVSCYLDFAKQFRGLETKLIYSDHHLSHSLTALAYSNAKKDICSVVVDGFGDRSTASISQVIDPTAVSYTHLTLPTSDLV